MKRKTSVQLHILVLLLASAVLGSVSCHPREAALIAVSPTAVSASADPLAPTDPTILALSFTTETLPETADLGAYPMLQTLDLTVCEQVDAARYEAIRKVVPAACRVLWSVPLTDGRFPSDSTELVLPHFSEEDAALLPCFEQLTVLDASGSTAYDALLTLLETRPDLSLTFTLPAGDRVLTMDDKSLTLTDAPDLALLDKMLAAFPQLQELDMSEAAVDPAQAATLAEHHPQLSVLYSVPIGRELFSRDAESIALDKSGVQTVQEVLDALPYLPRLTRLDLHGTGLTLSDLVSILDTYPDLILSHRVELLGEMVETDIQELDLREKECSPEELSALLKPFTGLQKVYLPNAMDGAAAISLLQSAHPETVFLHEVTVFGQTLDNSVKELDISHTVFLSPEEVSSQLLFLPCLKKLVMCDCGLTNEQMEELMAAFPRIKFVWNVQIGPHTLRTDTTAFSTKNPSKHINAHDSKYYKNWIKTCVRLQAGDLAALKYCTDLVALDLGHNHLTSEDLEVFRYLPHLQVLILADNEITDISALAYLKELVFVELFMNSISDVSPLVDLPNLVDINICRNQLTDNSSLLQLTHAEFLWFSKNGLSKKQSKAVMDALPNCKCNYTAKGATDGWGDHPRYKWAKAFFADTP